MKINTTPLLSCLKDEERDVFNDEPLLGSGENECVRRNNEIRMKVYLFASCAAINSCNLGYDIGVNSVAAEKLQDSMDLSDFKLEIFLGFLNLFAMFGSLNAHYITDSLGRRMTFVITAIFFIIGVLILSTASSYGILLLSRVFLGLGVGFGLAIDPLYISEISPPEHRGFLVSLSEISINLGIVLGFTSGLIFGNMSDDEAWRYMFGMGIFLPSILVIVALTIMPESPRWLISKGRDEEAVFILRQMYHPHVDVELVVKEIHELLVQEKKAQHAVGWDTIISPPPALRRMLLVGIAVSSSQQLVGIESIQYYLSYIIGEAGVEDYNSRCTVLVLLGLLKLCYVIFASIMFDTRGRRPFIFLSLIGIEISLVLQAINFLLPNPVKGVSIFALAFYLAFFSIGLGPGAWLIVSEVFSNSVRAKGMSLATFSNRFIAFIMSCTFLSLTHLITWSGYFFLLSILTAAILYFMYVYLPETKSKSLEEISLYFAEITGDKFMLNIEESLVK